MRRQSPKLFLVVALFASTQVNAIAPGYAPAAGITQNSTNTTIKTVMTKIGTLPTDTLAKVYPAISQGVKIGASAVGTMASSVYAGSAALTSKMYVPISNVGNLAITMVSNIPKSTMASAALLALKSPYMGIAIVAGGALYDYINGAGVTMNAGVVTANIPTNCSPQQSPQAKCNADLASYNQAGYGFTSMTPGGFIAFPGNNYTYACTGHGGPLDGTEMSAGTCDNATVTPAPISDQDAINRFMNQSPPDPAAVVNDIVDKAKITPDSDPPVLTVPGSTPLSTTSKTNPDGTTQTVAKSITSTVAGDTVTATLKTVTTEKTAAGVTTATTTTNEPPLVNTTAGTSPATDSNQTIDTSGLAQETTLQQTNTKLDQAVTTLTDIKAELEPVVFVPPGTPSARTFQASTDLVIDSIKDHLPQAVYSDVVPECPVFSANIPFLNFEMVIDQFCTMDELIRPILNAISLFAYSLFGFFVILRT